ncbi:hypothetical protein FQN57_001271 [Myotisia sp. PD_48]|nr:hypothetical protein FQN57_001271 [Myotisia sp. PD_48]
MSGPQSQSGSEQDHGERQPRPFSIQKTPVSIQAPSFPSHLQLHALQQQKQNHSTEPTTRLLAPERAHIHSHTHHTIARPFSYVPSIRERTSEEEEPPPPPPLPSMPPKDHSNHSMQSSDRGIDQPHFDYSYHNSMPVPPPLSQHPAQFAPLADETDPPPPQHPQAEAPTQYTYTNSQVPQQEPPASPGPLPPKLNPPIDNQTRPLSHIHIAPDDNPLLSRSPAPTYHSRAASRVGTQVGFGSTATANGTPDIFSHIPGQAVHPQQGMKGGTWTYGLCHPTDIATCCLGLFCPCILYGKTQYRLSRKSKRKDPTNMLGYEGFYLLSNIPAFGERMAYREDSWQTVSGHHAACVAPSSKMRGKLGLVKKQLDQVQVFLLQRRILPQAI